MRPASRNAANLLEHRVGALRRLDREDMALSDHHGLADIERTHDGQHLESARDVAGGLGIGLVAPERARWCRDIRRHLMGTEQAKSIAFEDAADAGQ